MGPDRRDAASFTGGITSKRFLPATWPFGRLRFTSERISIRSPLGAIYPPVDLPRDEVAEVALRNRYLGKVIVVTARDGSTSGTTFVPGNPGKVLSALEGAGWPVSAEVRRPRVDPRLYLALAVVLIGLGIGELVLKSNQGAEIDNRSVEVVTRIDKVVSEGGKHYGQFRYEVDGHTYDGEVVLTRDRKPGEPLTIRYDPQKPTRYWEMGDDPPGADEWIFGPLGVVPGIFLIYAYRRQRGMLRYLTDRGGPASVG